MLQATERRSIRRWTPNRKAEIIEAPESIQEQLMERFNISPDELAHWKNMLSWHGRGALRVTRCQEYR